MPRYDFYHEPVKRALIKDGWSIAADPFTLEYKEIRVLAALAAEKALAEGQRNVAGTDDTDSPDAMRNTVWFEPLCKVRAVLRDAESYMEDM